MGASQANTEFESVGKGPAPEPESHASLIDTFREREIEVVHSHEYTMAAFGTAAAKLSRLPHFITLHEGTYWARRWRRRAALRWEIRQSQGANVVSDPYRNEVSSLLDIPKERLRVVPNGIPRESGNRTSVRNELGMQDDEVLMVAVGNLYPVKGRRFLVETLGGLSRDRRWKLVIAGRGQEEQALRTMIAEHDLSARVQLLGLRQDIGDVLAAGDLFVMPSLSEGLPLAVLEAMAAGLPVVASAVKGIPHVTGPGRGGIMVVAGDVERLQEALEFLVANRQERVRMGKEAHEAWESSPFTVERMADAYEGLYLTSFGQAQPPASQDLPAPVG
jgi:glycosyltransferase involved in cell wall biosynthesis